MRCQHCYSDIRKALVTDDTTPPFISTLWLNAENRSPWCLREPCSGNGELHEIRHEPMPAV